jgi:MoaA/NifB/PqqE/SkfB family radical SAM enzyme
VVICSSVFQKEIAAACRRAGLEEGRDFLAATELQKCSWFVDVAGSCNLKCVSCPRGNWPRQPKPGFMSLENYAALLDKIAAEDPFAGVINLYSWGEPLLHPRLPEIIGLTRRQGFEAALSSNLSFRLDFEAVIRARPAYFRVSASGWGENYEVTHAGGSWALFMANLDRLRAWRLRHHPDMQAEMNFHIYKGREEDYRRMRDYCQEAGIIFRAGHGMLNPLDNVSRLMDGLEPTPEARLSIELQALPVERGLARLADLEGRPCPFETIMDVGWDGRVNHCQAWFDPGLEGLAGHFADSRLDEMLLKRQASPFCRKCRERLLHLWCGVYGDEGLTADSV